MRLDRGLVFMSDTRTNSGVDNISVFSKMFHWHVPGERTITLLTAGNLATTQAVVNASVLILAANYVLTELFFRSDA